MVLVASAVFGDPGGHGSDEVRSSSSRGEQGRATTEQSGRQHKSLSSHPPAFDQVHTTKLEIFNTYRPTYRYRSIYVGCCNQ